MDEQNNSFFLQGESFHDNKNVSVELRVLMFAEEDIYYAYVPALDILGYGYDEEEAKNSMEISLQEFFRYAINKNTLELEMTRLGWQKHKKNFHAPDITEQLSSNEQLRDIINHKQYKSTSYNVPIPAFA